MTIFFSKKCKYLWHTRAAVGNVTRSLDHTNALAVVNLKSFIFHGTRHAWRIHDTNKFKITAINTETMMYDLKQYLRS